MFLFFSVVESDLRRSSVNSTPPNKAQVAPLIRDTNLIEDGTLAYEVLVNFTFTFQLSKEIEILLYIKRIKLLTNKVLVFFTF